MNVEIITIQRYFSQLTIDGDLGYIQVREIQFKA